MKAEAPPCTLTNQFEPHPPPELTEARYVGCAELGDMAYEHELAGKDNNQALVNEKFEELKTEANRVYSIVKRYLGA